MTAASILMLWAAVAAQAADNAEDARPLVVVLAPEADGRAMSPDVAQLAGMLESELSSAARYGDVRLLTTAAATAGVQDPHLLGCNVPSCALEAGKAVNAQYVVTTQVIVVGRKRVINMRLLEVRSGRLVGMLSDKAGFEEDSLPPVAARASLRLASAAHLDKAPEKAPEPVVPPPPPEAVKPRTFDGPKTDPGPAVQTIVVPQEAPPAPGPQPAPEPQEEPEPPPPQSTLLQAQNDIIPNPNALPPGAPIVKESGRKVPWLTRFAIMGVGLLLGGWAPLAVPTGVVATTALLVRAVEIRNRLRERPHTTSEIAQMKQQGQIFEVSAYVVAGAAAALFLLGSTVLIVCVVISLVLP